MDPAPVSSSETLNQSLNSLSLGFLICKMETIMRTSQGYREDQMRCIWMYFINHRALQIYSLWSYYDWAIQQRAKDNIWISALRKGPALSGTVGVEGTVLRSRWNKNHPPLHVTSQEKACNITQIQQWNSTIMLLNFFEVMSPSENIIKTTDPLCRKLCSYVHNSHVKLYRQLQPIRVPLRLLGTLFSTVTSLTCAPKTGVDSP